MAIKPLPEDENGGAVVDGADGDGAKKPNAKKLILIIVLPLLLLVGGGAGAYFTGLLDGLLGKSGEEVAEGEHAAEGAADHGKKAEAPGKADSHGKKAAAGDGHGGPAGGFVQIPNLLVNLTSEGSQQRYLRLSVQIELANPADQAAVEAVMPRVVDQFQTYLRELRVKDLRGSAGIYRLQIELLNRVNAAAYPVEVKDVLFQEILVQ